MTPSSPPYAAARIMGAIIVLSGLVSLLIAPFVGKAASFTLWAVEPLTYIGGVLLVVGLAIASLSYLIQHLTLRKTTPQASDSWSKLTQQYFEMFSHDLGRPLRRVLGKGRELKAILQSSEASLPPAVKGLLDEIEQQAPYFRLMVTNIQVLVQLEDPTAPVRSEPVEPAEVLRRIVDRYGPIAAENNKEISWWAEPSEFGIVYSDTSAVEHIVTNLVDNTIRFTKKHIEVKLSKNPTHFFVRVWDDGPGIPSHYLPHIFDRGWTPEVARREEKTSSGLGLFIARTLAHRNGGELTVESATEPTEVSRTAFLLSLPLQQPR